MLKRQKQVTVRFTEEEYHQLKNKCDAAGMKMEPFLRALVSGCTIRERPPDSYKALAAQVAAVGNNLNQLTRLANSTGKIENSTLTAQRRALYRGKSKNTPADYSEQIQALTARIRELRREITTCADIEMDCEMVQDKVQRAAHRRENPPRERIHRRAY